MVRIGHATMELVRGDITELDLDALVNAANNYLWMGAGVAGAIKQKGGGVIEQEAVARGPIPVGAAVVTSAGALRARRVIHAAGMGQDLKADPEKVAEATRNSLLQAEKYGIRSVAFPAIGTGVGGLSVHLCARTMIDVVVEHLLATDRLDRVVFALYDEPAYQAFHDYLLQKFSAKH